MVISAPHLVAPRVADWTIGDPNGRPLRPALDAAEQFCDAVHDQPWRRMRVDAPNLPAQKRTSCVTGCPDLRPVALHSVQGNNGSHRRLSSTVDRLAGKADRSKRRDRRFRDRAASVRKSAARWIEGPGLSLHVGELHFRQPGAQVYARSNIQGIQIVVQIRLVTPRRFSPPWERPSSSQSLPLAIGAGPLRPAFLGNLGGEAL